MKICKFCKKEFEPVDKRHTYCSENCHKNDYIKICKYCKTEFQAKDLRRLYCSNSCSRKDISDNTRKKLSDSNKKFYSILKNRNRLKEIGRKGGFGKKGYTQLGVRYESSFEKNVYEYLENKQIKFIAHKYILNTSKISDLYLPNFDLWIELDGINREKKKKWLGNDYFYWKNKLQLYEDNKLNYKIFYNFAEFIKFIESI
jgi:hypothetical protein